MRPNSFIVLMLALGGAADRNFEIDYNNNQFLRDGKPFQYISAGIHYFRVPRNYWEDRLIKIRSSGANAIELYIPWNWHEPTPGNYSWTGDRDVEAFLKLAQKHDLVAIVRAGPYICGEWENGGFPWWLLKLPNITFRNYNPTALEQYEKWYSVLLPKLRPLLYNNGGPIIMVQVENEYGSYPACDMKYRLWLRDTFQKYLKNETVLFTVDGPGDHMLQCGHIPGTYATVDFGPGNQYGINDHFKVMRRYSPKGPLVDTEFYPGWLDLWGRPWNFGHTELIIQSMNYMYSLNVSFNFYMFHGGTNFGFWNGAQPGPPYQPVTTSYDYDAPLSEAGDPTPKFESIKKAIQNLTGNTPPFPTPPASPKAAYGVVNVENMGPITTMLNILSPESKRKTNDDPMSFEDMDFPYGFILYETVVNKMAKVISVPTIHDRGYVIQDNVFVGILQRERVANITLRKKYIQKIQILVENMGRINNGRIDRKGILSDVSLDGVVQKKWTMYPIQTEDIFPKLEAGIQSLDFSDVPRYGSRLHRLYRRLRQDDPYQPSIFYGTFPAENIEDTFFDSNGWGKGQLFINGYNLGRYWPSLGPQITLYVPKQVLKPVNTVVLLELEKPGLCSSATNCSINFIDYPILNKTVNTEWFSTPMKTPFKRGLFEA